VNKIWLLLARLRELSESVKYGLMNERRKQFIRLIKCKLMKGRKP
jgi:hypothetical protein